MVSHKTKSRTFRKVQVKTVSGTKDRYDRKKPKLGTCSVTGEKLKGVPRALPRKMSNMSKSSKRPTRPFGGVLSSSAARATIKKKTRSLKL